MRVSVCTTGPRSCMACLDRNTDVTTVSTQVPVIRLTHGEVSCFFHGSITVIVTITWFKSHYGLRKSIFNVHLSFKSLYKPTIYYAWRVKWVFWKMKWLKALIVWFLFYWSKLLSVSLYSLYLVRISWLQLCCVRWTPNNPDLLDRPCLPLFRYSLECRFGFRQLLKKK